MLKFFMPARSASFTQATSTLPIGTVMVPPVASTEQVLVISSPVISSFSANAAGDRASASAPAVIRLNRFDMGMSLVGKQGDPHGTSQRMRTVFPAGRQVDMQLVARCLQDS